VAVFKIAQRLGGLHQHEVSAKKVYEVLKVKNACITRTASSDEFVVAGFVHQRIEL
jgi:hypothetical protein